MGPIKSTERSGTLAFSPTAPYMAVGTMAGAIDLSFSSSACLEIFNLDFADASTEMPLAGEAVATSERFHRLVWGTTAADSETYPHGLLAGGLVDGTVNLWNPHAIVSGGGEDPLVTKLEKHTGAVKGLAFNSFSPNLLASGAADGELVIWDLTDPAAPSLFPALVEGGGGTPGEITYLAWNRKVQHILASTSANGTTVVWDLKRQRPVISFNDPNLRARNSCIQWNPEVATQLIVASDDDRKPMLQVWDLRNAVSPHTELAAHGKGVLSMAWCESDSSLLLSCAKDNRTYCWDTNSGEVVAEVPASANWNFDVQWSPRCPGVLSTASFDGKLSLHNLQNASAPGEDDANNGGPTGVNADFSAVTTAPAAARKPMTRAPAFMRRPCGAQFGFGGRLVSFKPGGVTLHSSLVTDEALVAASTEFEAAAATGDKAGLREFCSVKGAAAGEPVEAEVWEFLRVLFEDDARRQLLTHLDFEPEDLEATAKAAAEKVEAEKAEAEKAAAEAAKPPATPPAGDDDDADAFFDNLTAESPKKPAAVEEKKEKKEAKKEKAKKKAPEAAPAAEAESEAEVQKALVVGNYGAAVDACLAADRFTDALLLASMGGGELWARAQAAVMERRPRPYMKVVSALMKKELRGLVEERPTAAWRETLALLCTYAPKAQWAELTEALAEQLATAGDTLAATLCFITAGAVEKAAAIWVATYRAAGAEGKSADKAKAVSVLHAIMEKAVVLIRATGTRATSPSLAEVINEYATLLVAQGQLATALKYLCMLPGEDTPPTAVLRDRIYRSGLVPAASLQPPPFPFVAEEVASPGGVKPAAAAKPAQQQQQQQQQQAQRAAAVQPVQQHYQQYGQQQSQQQRSAYPQPMVPAYPVAHAAPQSMYSPQPAAMAPSSMAAPAPTSYMPQQPQQHAAYQPQPTGYAPAAPAAAAAYQAHPSHQHGAVAAAPAPPPPAAGYAPAAPVTATFQPQSFQPQPMMVPAAAAAAYPAAQQQAQFMAPGMPQQQHAMPGMTQQQQRPAAPEPEAPPARSGPPANLTLETVDTSAVAAESAPVVASLTTLYQACAAVAAAPAKKKESEDNSKRLAVLFYKLNADDVSAAVCGKLLQLCAALDSGDYGTATQIQVGLTTSDWDECSQWLTALKRLVKTRSTLG